MNKIRVLCILLVMMLLSSSSAVFQMGTLGEDSDLTLTFEQPEGGETWTGGSLHNISWDINSTYNDSEFVIFIDYVFNGTGPYDVGGFIQGDAENYTWRVPEINSTDVRLMITAQGKGMKAWAMVEINIDSSGPVLNSFSPQDGDEHFSDSPIEFNFSESVDISDFDKNFTLLRDGKEVNGIITREDKADNTLLKFNPAGELEVGSNYTFELTGNISDLSDPGNEAIFNITVDFTAVEGPPEVFVTAPSISDIRVGNKTTIKWSVGDAGLANDPIGIYYSLDEGESWKTIKEGMSNTGSHTWKIPDLDLAEYPVKNVIVNVTCMSKDGYVGHGHSLPFTIFKNKIPNIEVIRPYLGSYLVKDEYYRIRWRANDDVKLPSEPIVISVSTDRGKTWRVIGGEQEDDGFFDWKVDVKAADRTIINVSCTDSDGETGWAHSPQIRTLRENPLGMTLDPKNGSYYCRETINVSWKGPQIVEEKQKVRINFTGDGENWRTLFDGEVNRSYQHIKLPFQMSSSCRLKLEVYDESGIVNQADSHEFTVFPRITNTEVESVDGVTMISISFEGWVQLRSIQKAFCMYRNGKRVEVSDDDIYSRGGSTIVFISPQLKEGSYRIELSSTDIDDREFEDRTVMTFKNQESVDLINYLPFLLLIPLALILIYLYRGKSKKPRKISKERVKIER